MTEMRAAWRQLLAQLRAAPATDAQRFGREIVADICDLFALLARPAPPQRSGNVVDLVAWLNKAPRSAGRR